MGQGCATLSDGEHFKGAFEVAEGDTLALLIEGIDAVGLEDAVGCCVA